jgi:hypothetical protein
MDFVSILPASWAGSGEIHHSTIISDPFKQFLHRAARSHIRTERYQVVASSPESSQVSHLPHVWLLFEIAQHSLIFGHYAIFYMNSFFSMLGTVSTGPFTSTPCLCPSLNPFFRF